MAGRAGRRAVRGGRQAGESGPIAHRADRWFQLSVSSGQNILGLCASLPIEVAPCATGSQPRGPGTAPGRGGIGG